MLIAALWVDNSDLLVAPDADAAPFAHRGAHQFYTAEPRYLHRRAYRESNAPIPRKHEPVDGSRFRHRRAGAEIDIHVTPSDVFAVFCDWTLNFRSDGTGQTNHLPFTDLQSLDDGYDYQTHRSHASSQRGYWADTASGAGF